MVMTEKTAAEFIMKTLRDAGFEAFLAGGCVRDLVLGREPKDYDITTNAHPEQVVPLFEKTIPVGAAFGVVVVMVEGHKFEVATYRTDGRYSDGRRPDTVAYSNSAEEDVLRRDFTMNGLLLHSVDLPYLHDTVDAYLVDYVGGIEDIRARLIRCIGNPYDRFSEDALRMLRAVRFAAQLGFDIHPETQRAIINNVDNIQQVSRERITEELKKLVTAKYPVHGLAPLFSTGLFSRIFDKEFVKNHASSLTLERFSMFPMNEPGETPDPVLGLAMLFADTRDNCALQTAVKSLKLSTKEEENILGSVYSRVEIGVVKNDADVKLLARQSGILPYGLELFEQDLGMGLYNLSFEEGMNQVLRMRALKPEDIYPTPLVTGDDLIAMGLTPSPLFKVLLREVEYLQLNGQFSNAEEALQFAREEAARNASGKLPLLLL